MLFCVRQMVEAWKNGEFQANHHAHKRIAQVLSLNWLSMKV